MIFIWFWEVFHLTGVFLLKQCAGWLAGFLSIFFFVCFVSFRFVFWAPYKTYRSPRGKAPEIHYSHYVSALRPWRGVSSWAKVQAVYLLVNPGIYQGYPTTWLQKTQFSGLGFPEIQIHIPFKQFQHTTSNQFFWLILMWRQIALPISLQHLAGFIPSNPWWSPHIAPCLGVCFFLVLFFDLSFWHVLLSLPGMPFFFFSTGVTPTHISKFSSSNTFFFNPKLMPPTRTHTHTAFSQAE